MSHFDVYGKMAKEEVDETCQNGRYAIQKEAEKNIPDDILSKLKICRDDSVLDIGCGLGLNIKPIAQVARRVVGCDHPNVIDKMRHNFLTKVELIGGDFLEIEFKEKFDKILAYSVLPALPDKETLFKFVEKALSLMQPYGRMLLGDLANADKKSRFLNSQRGEAFQREWKEKCSQQNDKENLSFFSQADHSVPIDDALIVELLLYIRTMDFHAYVVDQPHDLPFGNSREDILVIGPEYSEF